MRLTKVAILMIAFSDSSVADDWLASTPYVDHDSPAIIKVVDDVTRGIADERLRAIAIHDFVRDEIPFGWAGAFYDQSASRVLQRRIGYCNTKSTLIVAMFRAAGIPARQHFVDISASVLDGLIDPGTSYVDHSFVEVSLAGKWIRIDSYIVDLPLAKAARAKLRQEGRNLGYGVHVNGVSVWDGRSDAFSQFVNDGSVELTTRDYGVHDDVGAFYADSQVHFSFSGPARLLFPPFAWRANARAERLRRL